MGQLSRNYAEENKKKNKLLFQIQIDGEFLIIKNQIIDVLMFNSREDIKKLLLEYKLEGNENV